MNDKIKFRKYLAISVFLFLIMLVFTQTISAGDFFDPEGLEADTGVLNGWYQKGDMTIFLLKDGSTHICYTCSISPNEWSRIISAYEDGDTVVLHSFHGKLKI